MATFSSDVGKSAVSIMFTIFEITTELYKNKLYTKLLILTTEKYYGFTEYSFLSR